MTELFHLLGGGTDNRGSWEDTGDCRDKWIGNCYGQRSLVNLHAPIRVNLNIRLLRPLSILGISILMNGDPPSPP